MLEREDLQREGLKKLRKTLQQDVSLRRENAVDALRGVARRVKEYQDMFNVDLIPGGVGLVQDVNELIERIGKALGAEHALKLFDDHAHDYGFEVDKT